VFAAWEGHITGNGTQEVWVNFNILLLSLQIIDHFYYWLRLRYFCLRKNTDFLPKQQNIQIS